MASDVNGHPFPPRGEGRGEDATIKHGPTAVDTAFADGCVLFVSKGPMSVQGRWLAITQKPVIVGRGDECDLVLADQNVSRHHMKLRLGERGIMVEDLGSTNGIRYLGKRIRSATLHVGTRLFLGDCQLDLLPVGNGSKLPLFEGDSYGELLGISLPMRRLFAALKVLESSETPVLINGETGTGKELVARALHRMGQRADKPFLVVDCGAIPAELMESEMFGHRKGAFTGAFTHRVGVFEAAHGGTVFLDEIGELPLALQPKLLRVLESGEFKRIGDVQHTPTDVRIISATKRDLAADVVSGLFRDDLFYRIAVVRLSLPPLRDRPDDILMLSRHFVTKIAGLHPEFPREFEEMLLHHHWPGNVRELRNVVQRAVAMSGGQVPPSLDTGLLVQKKASHEETGQPVSTGWNGSLEVDFHTARDQVIEAFERRYISLLWGQTAGNVSTAARKAGVGRKFLRKLLEKYGLR